MDLTFEKLEPVKHTVSPEVFINEHLHTVIDLSDGYYLYAWDERTYGLIKVCVIPKKLVDFNPAYKDNWKKLIPILEQMKDP